MQKKSFFLSLDDGAEIYVRFWDKTANPQGLLLITHGMAEHIERYSHLAAACNQAGFICVGSDLRGHGRTGEKSGLFGYFAARGGFKRIVRDLYLLNRWSRERFPNLPIFLLGHSLGSFLARHYIQEYGESLNGAILMGSAGDPGPLAAVAKLLAAAAMQLNPKGPSPFLDGLVFNGYNRRIKGPESKFDWLSSDKKEVEQYLQDPFCGFTCSAALFHDLFTGLQLIHDNSLIEKIPKGLPLLVLSGTADPVGDYGRGVLQFVAQYEKQGLQEIKAILYPGLRHELLNEKGKSEVIQDICSWLQGQLHLKKPA